MIQMDSDLDQVLQNLKRRRNVYKACQNTFRCSLYLFSLPFSEKCLNALGRFHERKWHSRIPMTRHQTFANMDIPEIIQIIMLIRFKISIMKYRYTCIDLARAK